jgi:hypothetical protein
MSWEFCDYLYQMAWILPFVYTVLFIFLIFKMSFFVIPQVTTKNLVLLFIMKLLAAISVGMVYTYYYSGADFDLYFSDSSKMIHNIFTKDQLPYLSLQSGFEKVPVMSGTKLMIIINAVMQLFSFGNRYVHFVFFCFFSFVGLTALLKIFLLHFPDKKRVVLSLFMIPGVLFWGSGPLKEAVVIGTAGLLIYITDFGLRKKYNRQSIVSLLFLILFLLILKFYILISLLPAFICNVIVSKTSNRMWIPKYALIVIILAAISTLAAMLNPDFNVLNQISDRQGKAISEARGGMFLVNDKNFISVDYKSAGSVLKPVGDSLYKIADGSGYLKWKLDNMEDTTFVTDSKDTASYYLLYKIVPANSSITLKRIKPDLKNLLENTPAAFINSLMRPTLSEIHSWFHWASAIENLLIIALIVIALFFTDKKVLAKKEIIWFCITFSFIQYVLIGLTTPVIGAMLRYKVVAEMLIATVCFIVIDQEKIRKILFRKSKETSETKF